MVEPIPHEYLGEQARARIALVAASYRRLLGCDLVAETGDPVAALWAAPLAILAHGTGADPVFFFANRAALAAFETTPSAIITMPSRLSAEPLAREERQALLDRVSADGFIADYAGVRISALGRRFRIEQAVVWNLLDEAGAARGQAACFAPPEWTTQAGASAEKG
jgi:hypothetical protein